MGKRDTIFVLDWLLQNKPNLIPTLVTNPSEKNAIKILNAYNDNMRFMHTSHVEVSSIDVDYFYEMFYSWLNVNDISQRDREIVNERIKSGDIIVYLDNDYLRALPEGIYKSQLTVYEYSPNYLFNL